MKKYIYLKEGDTIQEGDEQKGLNGWLSLNGDYFGTKVRYSEEKMESFRRPIPHTGDVQFLMCVSILVPVIVNCDGREQESIEAEAGELAYQKVLDDPRRYISYENVDWESCKVDEVQPEPSGMDRLGALQAGIDKGFINDSIGTGPKNPGKKALDYCNARHNQGLGIAWGIANVGNSENEVLQVQRIDEPEHEGISLIPLESDEKAWGIAMSLGWKLDDNGYVLAYPGEEPKNPGKYRMLEIGEEVLDGDEFFSIHSGTYRVVSANDKKDVPNYHVTEVDDVRRKISAEPIEICITKPIAYTQTAIRGTMPESQYQILEVGETIEAGDEIFDLGTSEYEKLTPADEWLIGLEYRASINKMRRQIIEPQYPIGCEKENGYGESKDGGKTGFWMVFDKGQQSGVDTNSIHPKKYFEPRVERIDEPNDHEPLESDEIAWELAKLAGYDLDVNGYVCEFPFTHA